MHMRENETVSARMRALSLLSLPRCVNPLAPSKEPEKCSRWFEHTTLTHMQSHIQSTLHSLQLQSTRIPFRASPRRGRTSGDSNKFAFVCRYSSGAVCACAFPYLCAYVCACVCVLLMLVVVGSHSSRTSCVCVCFGWCAPLCTSLSRVVCCFLIRATIFTIVHVHSERSAPPSTVRRV